MLQWFFLLCGIYKDAAAACVLACLARCTLHGVCHNTLLLLLPPPLPTGKPTAQMLAHVRTRKPAPPVLKVHMNDGSVVPLWCTFSDQQVGLVVLTSTKHTYTPHAHSQLSVGVLNALWAVWMVLLDHNAVIWGWAHCHACVWYQVKHTAVCWCVCVLMLGEQCWIVVWDNTCSYMWLGTFPYIHKA